MATRKPAKTPAKKPASTKKKPAVKAAVKPEPKAVKLRDVIVNQTEMAEAMGVTTRWLRVLVTDGVIQADGRGKFHVGSTFQAYAAFLKEGATKKTGSSTMDELRAEKIKDIQIERMRNDRELISMDEAMAFYGELTGVFVSYLSGLPAEITGVPRERQRLNDIIDLGRQRIADSFVKKRRAFESGLEDPDTADED